MGIGEGSASWNRSFLIFLRVAVDRFFGLWRRHVLVPAVLAFPCFLAGLLAFPLCGGAPTFLCLPQRKVGKRKRLKPPIFKRVPWLGGCRGPVEIGPVHVSA